MQVALIDYAWDEYVCWQPKDADTQRTKVDRSDCVRCAPGLEMCFIDSACAALGISIEIRCYRHVIPTGSVFAPVLLQVIGKPNFAVWCNFRLLRNDPIRIGS